MRRTNVGCIDRPWMMHICEWTAVIASAAIAPAANALRLARHVVSCLSCRTAAPDQSEAAAAVAPREAVAMPCTAAVCNDRGTRPRMLVGLKLIWPRLPGPAGRWRRSKLAGSVLTDTLGTTFLPGSTLALTKRETRDQ